MIGALVIYSTSNEAFVDKEMELLAEMAGDLSLGIAKIRFREEILKTQEALKASEQNFRNSLDSSFIGINIVDTEFRILYANQALLDIFGYKNIDEVKATPPQEYYTPESRVSYILRNEKILRGEPIPGKVEVDIVRKDGGMRHLQLFRKEVRWDGKLQYQILYNDITERKQAEEKLRSEQIMLARTEAIAHVGSWEWDVASETVTWSDELFRIFQWDPQEGAPSFAEHPALYLPEDMARLQQAVEAAVADGTPYELELRAIRKDGETRTCLARGVAEMAMGGRAVRLFGSLQDITERKKAEERLRESENQYMRLVNNVPDIIFTMDLEGKLTFVSQRIEEILGYERAEAINMNILNFIPAEDRQRAMETLQKGMTGEKIIHFQIPMIKKSGERLFCECSFSRIYKNGASIGAQGIAADITDKKHAEEALKASEQNFRNSLDVSPMGIRIGQGEQTLYANKAFLDMFGYENIDELKASPLYEHYTPESYAAHLQRREQFLRGESLPDKIEIDIVRKDGAIRYLMISRSEVFWNGKQQALLLYDDLTERKQAEDKLRENESRYSAIVENLPQKIFLRDINLAFIMCNENFAREFKLKPEEIIGKTDYDLHPKEMADKYTADDRKIIASGEMKDIEEPHIYDGKEQIVRLIKVPVKDINGNVTGIAGMYWDITEQKHAEEALKASEQNFRNSLDVSPMGIRIGQGEQALYANKAFLDMFGYEHMDELKASPLYEHFTPETYEVYLQRREQFLRGESLPDKIEIDIVRKDGAIRHLLISRSEVFWNGKQQALLLYDDVSERMRAEKQKELSLRVLQVLNQSGEKKKLIHNLLELFKEDGHFEAVGIRLHEGDDYPYYETNGFPDKHIKAENRLCAVDDEGKILRDSQNKPILGCMCGNVISGQFDPSKPFFTEAGSFWTNSTTDWLASTKGEVKQTRIRDGCSTEGYESVALIPLKAGKDTLGLLQINDTRRDCFTRELIQYYEGLAQSIGIGLAQKQSEEALKASEQNFRNSLDSSLIGTRIANPDGDTLYANQAFLNMFGYENIDEVRTSPPQEHYTPESYADYLRRKEQFKGGELLPDALEMDIIRKDGAIRQLQIFNKKVLWNGKEETQCIKYQIK